MLNSFKAATFRPRTFSFMRMVGSFVAALLKINQKYVIYSYKKHFTVKYED